MAPTVLTLLETLRKNEAMIERNNRENRFFEAQARIKKNKSVKSTQDLLDEHTWAGLAPLLALNFILSPPPMALRFKRG